MFKKLFQTKREWALGLITLALLILLVVKSVVLDPQLGTLSEDQKQFRTLVEKSLDDGYRQQWAYRYGLLVVRIVSIEAASETELKEAQALEVPAEYPYIAKMRKYLLGVLPIGELKLMQ